MDVLQGQWLILALGLGLGVLFACILLFMALWRPREDAAAEGVPAPSSVPSWLRSFMPAVLVLLALGLAAFAVVYVVSAMRRPPNW
jgi:hypothetical protein